MPGVFTIEVEDEGGDFLAALPDRVDRMMVDIVNDTVEHAAREIRGNAASIGSGSIALLVEEDKATLGEIGKVEGAAGVTPAHDLDTDRASTTLGKTALGPGGIGSDPRDYPFFVHEGTAAITTLGLMHINFADGGEVFTHHRAGQEPQPYVAEAFEETSHWLPVRLATARLPSGGT